MATAGVSFLNLAMIAALVGSPPPPICAVKWFNTESPVELKSLRGKVVLLDFWGLWRTPCRKELPAVTELHRKFAARGLVIIGIHTPQKEDQLTRFLQENKVPMIVAVDSGTTAEAYGVDGYPTYVLIDRNGAAASLPKEPPTA